MQLVMTNDGLTRFGRGCFIAVYLYGNSGRQRVNMKLSRMRRSLMMFSECVE